MMQMQKYIPSELLRPFVKEYIVIRTSYAKDNLVMPVTSLAMTFRFGEEVHHTTATKELVPYASVSGLKRSVHTFSYLKGSANLITIFSEAGLGAFSKVPAYELFGVLTSSEDIFPKALIRETSQKVLESSSDSGRIKILENFLLTMLKRSSPDRMITEAVRRIRESKGNLRMKELAAFLCCSQDAFEKRFRAHVGSSPKQYASIVRFRTVLESAPKYSLLSEAAYEAGYFDQSHFIKDFRQYSGQSPAEFFRSPEYW